MGIGDWVSGVFGSENKAFANTPETDPNAYQYGGRAGYAQETADRYRSTAEQAQSRQGVTADSLQADKSRASQQTMANAMKQRALGQTPSIAQMQADRQMQQAAAAQGSQAASARGAAGMALAQQGAANNIANAQGAISGQAQINAANERMQAEQAAFGAFGNMRGQDAQQAQFNAQMADAQRARNDAMTMGMSQMENQVQTTQLGAQMNQQAQQAANQLGAASINAGVAGQNASMAQQNGQGLFSMGQSAAGAVAGALADGGPMKGKSDKPYLVGERGPELVVPKKDAVVIPAEETQQILSPANIATSTWGVGKGVTPSMAEEDFWKKDRERAEQEQRFREMDADRDRRLAGGGGGMAVPGGPGSGVSASEPLIRADQEAVALARAKQAEGLELTADEERKLGGARHRLGETKKAERQNALSDFFKQSAASSERQGAAVDVGYHGPSGYVPPQLIQISGYRAMGGPIDSGGAYVVGEKGPEMVMPQVQKPITPALAGGQQITNPAGHSSGLGRLAIVHHLPSIEETNKATFKSVGPAAAMAPGAGVATHGYGVGSVEAARADGGPVDAGKTYLTGERGAEMVVPLMDAPDGRMLQMGDDGRAFYQSAPTEDDGRPSLAKALAPQPKSSPLEARAPVSLPPAMTKPKTRKMTDDELMRAAEQMGAQMKSDHEKRMAQGPAVSLASRMGSK